MNRLFFIARLATVIVLSLVFCATQPALTHPAMAAADLPIYADALAGSWQDWSWDTTRSFDNTQPVYSGSASIAVTYTAAWAGLYLHTDTALPASDYTAIQFWVHGGSAGSQSVNFHVGDRVSYSFTAQANTWLSVRIPLTALGNPATLSDLVWQDGSGHGQPTFYLDDISLIGTPPFNGWLVLNGTDKYASAPYQSGLDLSGKSFTVEMWLKLSDSILSMDGYSVDPFHQRYGFYFYLTKTQNFDVNHVPVYWYTYCRAFSVDNSYFCPNIWSGLSLGTDWGHLAGVYDKAAGETGIYWNGVLLWSEPQTQMTNTPGDLFINQSGYSFDNNLVGLVDEVRISDIARYSGSFTPPTAPFVCDANTKALWHFDEPEGSTVFHDSCGTEDNFFTGYNGAHTEGVTGSRVYLPLVMK